MVADLSQLAGWMAMVATRRWSWFKNNRCKYVTIKIDTRTGVMEILDRNMERITFEQLEYQRVTEEVNDNGQS